MYFSSNKIIKIVLLVIIYIYINPSAGIGRQDKFKLCWYYVINVQVVFRIKLKILNIFYINNDIKHIWEN